MENPELPSEDPQVTALFEAASRATSGPEERAIREISYQDFCSTGTVNVGDTLIMHRAAPRDVNRGEAATLVVKVTDISTEGSTVLHYRVEGLYSRLGEQAQPQNGRMLLGGQIFIMHEEGENPQFGAARSLQDSTYSNFKFSKPTEPIRIYLQSSTPRSASGAMRITTDAQPPQPLAPEVFSEDTSLSSPEVAAPRTGLRAKVSSVLSGLRGLLPKGKE